MNDDNINFEIVEGSPKKTVKKIDVTKNEFNMLISGLVIGFLLGIAYVNYI